MELLTVPYQDLRGGVNYGVLPSDLPATQLAGARNLKPVGSRIRTRGGMRLLAETPNAPGVPITGFTASELNGQWAGVAWSPGQLGYFSGNNYGYSLIANLAVSNGNPWIVAEWQRTLFGARPVDETGLQTGLILLRLEPFPVAVTAGIEPPTFTAVAAAGAAGVLTAANYQYVFTYGDSLSGSESSYGPVSNTLALGANLQINLSGLVASANPRVNVIHIYRTLPNGTGAWLRVATIPHTQTTYADNIPVGQQGPLASATNGLPPANIFTVVVWQNRVWVTDGKLLYPSKLNNPEAFNPADALSVGGATDSITGLLATQDALVIGRDYGMSYLTGTGATSWEIKESDRQHGLAGPSAICLHGKTAYWESKDGLYAGTGLSEGKAISGDRLRPLYQTDYGAEPLPTDELRRLIVSSCPTTNGVLFTTPLSGEVMLYHSETDSLWPWTISAATEPVTRVRLLTAQRGPDGRMWAWSDRGNSGFLVKLDDESLSTDEFGTQFGSLPVAIQPMLALKFLNFGARKALIRSLRVEWSAIDPVVTAIGDPTQEYEQRDTTAAGNVVLSVFRQYTGAQPSGLFFGSGGSELIQPRRLVPFAPKTTLGKRDFNDNWKSYALKTNSDATIPSIPSNTLGLEVNFAPIVPGMSDPAEYVTEALWIGNIILTVLVTDLPETRF